MYYFVPVKFAKFSPNSGLSDIKQPFAVVICCCDFSVLTNVLLSIL